VTSTGGNLCRDSLSQKLIWQVTLSLVTSILYVRRKKEEVTNLALLCATVDFHPTSAVQCLL